MKELAVGREKSFQRAEMNVPLVRLADLKENGRLVMAVVETGLFISLSRLVGRRYEVIPSIARGQCFSGNYAQVLVCVFMQYSMLLLPFVNNGVSQLRSFSHLHYSSWYNSNQRYTR
jgi:hypothetical protein